MTNYIMIEIPPDSEYNTPVGHILSNKMLFRGKIQILSQDSATALQYWLDDVEGGNEHASEPTELEEVICLLYESEDYCDIYEGQTLVDEDDNEVIVQRVFDLTPEGYQTWMKILEEEE